MWSITLKASDVMNGSVQPNTNGTMIRCPDEEIGRNSVSPCTTPMMRAWMIVSMTYASHLTADAGVAGCARSFTHLGVRSLTSSPAPWPRLVICDDSRFRARGLPDEQRGQNQRDRCEELDEDVEGGARGVLERVADRVADDRGCVGVGLLAKHVPVSIEQMARLHVLLGVVPRSTAVVQDGCEHDARDGPDHQHAGDGLGTEEEPDQDRQGDRHEARGDHLAQGRP